MLLGTIWNNQERPLYIAVFLHILLHILCFRGAASALKSLAREGVSVQIRLPAPCKTGEITGNFSRFVIFGKRLGSDFHRKNAVLRRFCWHFTTHTPLCEFLSAWTPRSSRYSLCPRGLSWRLGRTHAPPISSRPRPRPRIPYIAYKKECMVNSRLVLCVLCLSVCNRYECFWEQEGASGCCAPSLRRL